jgi:head-tail adaptor
MGKMNAIIDIVDVVISKDAEGFANSADVTLASVNAYKEERHGSKMWMNRAAFSSATCLFQFRYMPNMEITDKQQIICNGKRYKILSAENVRSRNMYWECLCEKWEVSKGG